MKRIYLDYNATTPLNPEVLESMLPWLRESFGNPSSAHASGRCAAAAVDRSRVQVAELIDANADEIIFTSGATEANNTIIAHADGKIVAGGGEHSSVYEPALATGAVFLPLTRNGQLLQDALKKALEQHSPALVSLILANNETGVITNLDGVAKIVHDAGALLHLDAVQAVGKIPVNVQELNADFLSLSAHKIYGPKGVGALFVRRGIKLTPLIRGGGQEGNRRSGTHNVPAIVGMGVACTIARRKIDQYKEHCSALLEHLENQILKKIPDVTINGANEPRVSNTLNVSFTGLDAGLIATRLDMAGIEVSVGSACSSGRNSSSRVLEAMGLSRHESLGAIRFSLGWDNDAAMIDETVSKLAEIVETLRHADQAANVIKF